MTSPAPPGFVDALNNWYIRSRHAGFWSEGHTSSKLDAFDTLYTALTIFCRALAPMLPLITERIAGASDRLAGCHCCVRWIWRASMF
jgi:isoleucyl-tRNA synthetase